MKQKRFILPIISLLMLASCGNNSTSSANSGNSQAPKDSTAPTSQIAPTTDTQTSTSTSTTPVVQSGVTFDLNYTGSTSVNQKETEGSVISSFPNVTRTGYLFSYWSYDVDGKNVFDISSVVNSDLTLYANWIADDDSAVTVTFHSEDSVYIAMSVKSNSRLKTFPGTLTKVNKFFKNWYTESTFENVATTVTKYTADTDIYARWYNIDVFEAEYTKLTDLTEEEDPNCNSFGEKVGHGYSSDVCGTGLIFTDADVIGNNCSNHHFVGDLYYKDAFIEFDFESSEAVTDAVLNATLSAEYYDMTFTKDNWIVEVNGESINYGTITLDNVPTGRDNRSKRAFTTHTLSTALTLKKGKNVIKLITNNSTRHDSTGTMAAEAPMIDCISLYSDVNLTFDSHTDNL